ncbi:hypothetical protein VTL71DRAFT_5740 [Oculimacula yallundae]|uniref:Uncharacterized protein n=1 Tax=Oculimacula yallundae TaxID=86028 RepID=A0ABR4BYE7_9HELO
MNAQEALGDQDLVGYTHVRGYPNTSLTKHFNDCHICVLNLLFPEEHPSRYSFNTALDYRPDGFDERDRPFQPIFFDYQKLIREITTIRLPDGTQFNPRNHVIQIVDLQEGGFVREFKDADNQDDIARYLRDGMDFGVQDFVYEFRVVEIQHRALRRRRDPERSLPYRPEIGSTVDPLPSVFPALAFMPRSEAAAGSNRGHLPPQARVPPEPPLPQGDDDPDLDYPDKDSDWENDGDDDIVEEGYLDNGIGEVHRADIARRHVSARSTSARYK